MDPLTFGMNGDVVVEVLGTIVLLSLLIERFLSPFFEWRIVLDKIKEKGLKEPIAFALSFFIIYTYEFDAMAIIFTQDKNSIIGFLITAGVVAGGSKGAVKLFRDYLGWKSVAQKEAEEKKAEN